MEKIIDLKKIKEKKLEKYVNKYVNNMMEGVMSLMNHTYTSHLGKYGDYDVFAEIEKETNMPVRYRAVKSLDDKVKVTISIENKNEGIEWTYGLHVNDPSYSENKNRFDFYKKQIKKGLNKMGLGDLLESVRVYDLNFPKGYYNVMTEIIFKGLGDLDSHFNHAVEFYERNIKGFYEGVFLK